MRKINKIEPLMPALPTRKKVAAYARVSMESKRLQHSLSAQVSYYSELIQSNPEWEYAGVYADDGITGTKTNREEFQRLLADCEAGKIDIILTKSISRFARNTVDLLETVRHLKELGIEVRFEKERINSLSGDGEVMLTLLASFAQEEIISLSNNVKWGIRKRMEQGIPNGHFRVYGYRWEGDQLVTVPEEAAIVRRIFQNFLDGKSRLETEREFAAEGITTRDGCRWVDSNLKVVLTNITYTGNLLLQKEYVEDPLTKKRKKNRGELPQFYVEDTHEAIIDKETFDYVQAEMARRKELGAFANKSLNITCFTSKLKCSRCGCSYVRNQRANRTKHTSTYDDTIVVWGCGTQKKKGGRCSNKDIPERVLREACAAALVLEDFDEDIFLERVDTLQVLDGQVLEFHFYDGTVSQIEWVSTAKKDCWTDEHKDRQREWMRNYMANATDGRYSEFTTRIRCNNCGSNFRRNTQPSKSADGGKMHYWRCPTSGDCVTTGIREDRLKELTASVMGLSEHDAEAFKAQIEYISVAAGMVLTFHFFDGREESLQYNTKRQGTAWTPERREKFKSSMQGKYTEERRQAMSENMKRIRSEKHWSSKRK
jgi:DNA invertase Pin-like site-specific DNA recombinase